MVEGLGAGGRRSVATVIQELLQLLPREPGTIALSIALIGTAIGVALCAAGARFSKYLTTLMTVLLGAGIGMALPHWFNWTISGAGPAVGGAVVLGVSGWLLHRFWIGIGLGCVLSCWAILVVWTCFRNGQNLTWPGWSDSSTVPAYVAALWHSLPRDVMRVLPYALVVAMVSGLACAILWDKPIVLLTWSAAGTTMLAIMGIASLEYAHPQWIKPLNVQSWIQCLALGSILGVSMLIQWKTAPVDGNGGTKKGGKKQPAEGAD